MRSPSCAQRTVTKNHFTRKELVWLVVNSEFWSQAVEAWLENLKRKPRPMWLVDEGECNVPMLLRCHLWFHRLLRRKIQFFPWWTGHIIQENVHKKQAFGPRRTMHAHLDSTSSDIKAQQIAPEPSRNCHAPPSVTPQSVVLIHSLPLSSAKNNTTNHPASTQKRTTVHRQQNMKCTSGKQHLPSTVALSTYQVACSQR